MLKAQLDSVQGLVLPGGESTTMGLVAERSGLLPGLRDLVAKGECPIFVSATFPHCIYHPRRTAFASLHAVAATLTAGLLHKAVNGDTDTIVRVTIHRPRAPG